MDTTPLDQHFESVAEIFENFKATKGEEFSDAVKFLGATRALDQVIGFAASEAFGDDEDRLNTYEYLVKQTLLQLMHMYFDYNQLSKTDIREAQDAALMLSERSDKAAKEIRKNL